MTLTKSAGQQASWYPKQSPRRVEDDGTQFTIIDIHSASNRRPRLNKKYVHTVYPPAIWVGYHDRRARKIQLSMNPNQTRVSCRTGEVHPHLLCSMRVLRHQHSCRQR